MQIVSGEEAYYVFTFNEIKDIENIEKYFEIKPEETGKIKLYWLKRKNQLKKY